MLFEEIEMSVLLGAKVVPKYYVGMKVLINGI
jgi:putative transposon-encoded protein